MGRASSDYLERVRALTARLAARDIGPEDVAGAMAAVADVLPLDVDAPTDASRPEGRLVKAATKRVTAWYVAYLAEQVNDLGVALLRLGERLAARVDRSDAARDDLARRVGRLEEAVEDMSTRLPVTGNRDRSGGHGDT